MDLAHFGLRSRPFRTTPDLDGYYPATTHEIALADLRRALQDDEALMLLTGEPGTGKTLLAHRLLEQMPEGTRTVFLTHGSFRRRSDLLKAILFDLELPYREMALQELRLELTESCLDHFRQHGRTVIVADEAHLLRASLLDELRLLGNLEGKDGRAVQVVLIGQPALEDTFDKAGLEVIRQRLSVRCRLAPLGVDESADYVLHQIRRAGGRAEDLLGEDVLDILCHSARGIPRVLNQAALCAFSVAEQAGSPLVDAEAAVEAVTRLGLDEAGPAPTEAESEPHELVREPDPEPAALPPPPSVKVMVEPARQGGGPPVYIYGDPDAVRRAG